NGLLNVLILTLPASGILTDNGVAVKQGASVPAADLAANKLVYTPKADANGAGAATFAFKVQDNGGTDNRGVDTDPVTKSMTFDITAVNDAPVLTGLETAPLSYTAKAPGVRITSSLIVSDRDNINLTGAIVQIIGNYQKGIESLNFVNTAKITGVFNVNNGIL